MSFVRTIKIKYEDSLWLLIPYCFLSWLILLLYRIELYIQSNRSYGDIFSISFPEYIFFSIGGDSTALFYMTAAMIIIIMTMDTEKKRSHFMLSGIILLPGIFLLLCIEFFRVYERSFHFGFINNEAGSGISELLQSVFAELSPFFLVKFVLLCCCIIVTAFLIQRFYNRLFKIVLEIRKNRWMGYIITWHPPVLVAILAAAMLLHTIDFNRHSPKEVNNLYYTGIMTDLTSNPLISIASSGSTASGFFNGSGAKDFIKLGIRFDTSSMDSGTSYRDEKIIPRGRKYNIILYFFESTPRQYLDIKMGGRYVMPTWNRLMEHSYIADNHYANYPLSANALLNVLASSYGKFDKGNVIQDHPSIKLVTLPEILRKQGYRTFLIHTGELGYSGQDKFLKGRGFEEVLDLNNLKYLFPYNSRVGWGLDERVMTKPSLEFIDRDPERPFFMVFMPVNPHHPYAIPDDSFNIAGDIGEVEESRLSWYNYLNSLHFADHALGDLIDTLEKKGHLEDTLVFLFSDHGEAFYQHRMNFNHPFFLYEENVHVPFIIYNKKIFNVPYHFSGISRHIDIMPSILDILGTKEWKNMEGISLFSPRREQMALLHTFWKDEYMGVRDTNWKYIVRISDGYEELYDLKTDPVEKNNMASQKVEIASKYRDFIKKARDYNTRFYDQLLLQ